jgi:DNA-binding NtrC family response regulator
MSTSHLRSSGHEHARPVLLIVDDDPLIADTLAFALGSDYTVYTSDSREDAIDLMRQLETPPELALVDLGLPPTPHIPDQGFKLIAELLAHSPSVKIFVLSGQNASGHARHARSLGATEFIAKPCDPELLRRMLARALALREAEIAQNRKSGGLVGASPALTRLKGQLSQFSDSPFPVLIEGESGSGKEVVARSLHARSRRAGGPFLALNCAAIAPTLMEPTLFGYAKGAFTGASAAKAGYFEDANEGTLFLDEIGDLPIDMQAKLLRVLENGEFQRVGETQSRTSRARIIAATNRDLRQGVRQGSFRTDLFHRLSVLTLTVPPLRELDTDRLALLEHFRHFYASQSGVQPFTLDAEAEKHWMAYRFPGNVRELRNIVIRLSAKYPGQRLGVSDLEPEFDADTISAEDAARNVGSTSHLSIDLVSRAAKDLEQARHFSLDGTLRSIERAYIEAATRLTHGNMSQAAKLLGVNRTTLYSRLANDASPDDEST